MADTLTLRTADDMTVADPSATISLAFANNREVLKISGFGYTNAATGTPTSGVVNGTTTYTVNLHNYGSSIANLTNSSLVVSLASGTGTVTCNGTGTGGLTKAITGTVAAGGDLAVAVTLTCTYVGMSDGAESPARRSTSSRRQNGLERTASRPSCLHQVHGPGGLGPPGRNGGFPCREAAQPTHTTVASQRPRHRRDLPIQSRVQRA